MSGRRNYTPEEITWIEENYPRLGMDAATTAFEVRFGYARSRQGLAVKAHNLGLHVVRNDPRTRTGATRKVFWSREPEIESWMLEHDHGRANATIDAFEARFGFRLTRAQVSLFRSSHRTVSAKVEQTNRGGRPARPIGYERDSGKGYVLVKVREFAVVPCSKDNWRMKHHLIWEKANGRPVPEDCEILFADNDECNFDPANLVAVPKRLAGIINESGTPYHDAESLHAAMALAELRVGIRNAEMRPRTCWRCGREFAPADRGNHGTRTCPDCVAAGYKAPPRLKGVAGEAICLVCGRTFTRNKKNQKRCPDCIARKPRYGVEAQKRVEEKKGGRR